MQIIYTFLGIQESNSEARNFLLLINLSSTFPLYTGYTTSFFFCTVLVKVLNSVFKEKEKLLLRVLQLR